MVHREQKNHYFNTIESLFFKCIYKNLVTGLLVAIQVIVTYRAHTHKKGLHLLTGNQ